MPALLALLCRPHTRMDSRFTERPASSQVACLSPNRIGQESCEALSEKNHESYPVPNGFQIRFVRGSQSQTRIVDHRLPVLPDCLVKTSREG